MRKIYTSILFGLIILFCSYSSIIVSAEEISEILTIPVGQSQLLTVERVERVAVTDPDVAEVVVISTGEILINGIGEGVTSLHLWLTDGYQKILLKVFTDDTYSAEQVSKVIDNPDVQVIKLKDTVILKGEVTTQHDKQEALDIASSLAEKVVDLLKVKNPLQVLIKAYVVEINREEVQKLGLEWGGLVRGVFKPGKLSLGQLSSNTLPVQLDLIGMELEASAKDNLTTVLAAPELIALSGKNSEILVGGEIPIIKSNDVIWKPYGIILTMTPEVLATGDIQVALEPEVSTIDWSNGVKAGEYVYPAFRTRRVNTTVTVEDGSVIVLGGLLSQKEIEEVQKVPFLGDLPIIGELFQSRQFREGESELVVMVQTWVLDDELIQKMNLEKRSVLPTRIRETITDE